MSDAPFFVDVQTSGATPTLGRILEIGWSDGVASQSVLVRGAEDAPPVPARILRLIGIEAAEIAEGVTEVEAFAALGAALAAACVGAGTSGFALAHFATFERRFLDDLWHRHAGAPFPLPFVCTHAVCKRLYPDLPSRSLRAIAGYLGLSLGQEKRAASHVAATAHIWAKLAPALAERGIASTAELLAWLAEKPARQGAARGPRQYAVDRGERLAIPDRPGVYRMLGHDGRVLYVGKATSLRSRVNSYFRQRRHAKAEMLTQVFKVETVATETALEAALFECDEIKRLDPPYNVLLRRGARRLGYFDRELRPLASAEGAAFGPFSRPDALQPLTLLWASLADASVARELVPALFYRDVQEEALGGGLALVADLAPLSLRSLLALGIKEARALAPEDVEDAEDAVDDESAVLDEETPLTAADVAAYLRSLVIAAGQSYLRMRKIRRLATGSVAWRERGERLWRRLDLRDGAIEGRAHVETVEAFAADVPPRGVPALDLAGYDRLRVLATELLHLASQGAEIHGRS